MQDQFTLKSGDKLGVYRIEAPLGCGGMAEVYTARHTGLQRLEALKLLPPRMAVDPNSARRFLREASIAANLRHPHIVAIYTVSTEAEPFQYFTMELVDGCTLGDLLHAQGRLPLAEVLDILTQVAEALDFAHVNQVWHRDIKPANILLSDSAGSSGGIFARVNDFGIARADWNPGTSQINGHGQAIGTPYYMSPEQITGSPPLSHHTDIYSLGIMAYEMLCGRMPFGETDDSSQMQILYSHVHTPPPPPGDLNPALSAAMGHALLRALAKDPTERFDTCGQFISALKSGTAGQAWVSQNSSTVAGPVGFNHPTPSAPTNRLPRPGLRSPLIGAIVGALVVGLAMANWDLHRTDHVAAISGRSSSRVKDSSAKPSSSGSRTPHAHHPNHAHVDQPDEEPAPSNRRRATSIAGVGSARHAGASTQAVANITASRHKTGSGNWAGMAGGENASAGMKSQKPFGKEGPAESATTDHQLPPPSDSSPNPIATGPASTSVKTADHTDPGRPASPPPVSTPVPQSSPVEASHREPAQSAPLRCPFCGGIIQPDWYYCKICHARLR